MAAQKHYYAARVGDKTYFRGSTNPNFAAIVMRSGNDWGFSSDASKGVGCTEISKAHYDVLVRLKLARVAAERAEIEGRGESVWERGWQTQPTASWVLNSAVPDDVFMAMRGTG